MKKVNPLETHLAKVLTLYFCFAVFTLAIAQSSLTSPLDSACGTLYSNGQYGPYDFRTDPDKVPIVLGAHFTPEVENLIRGKSATVGGDLDYTLRALPNFHRALISMIRLSQKEKLDPVRPGAHTVECYLKRAIAFRSNDAIVRIIYSSYLYGKAREKEASDQLVVATNLAKDNGFTHYNIGLHYFDMKNYALALQQAHKAIELGFVRTELRDQLKAVNQWKDPIAPVSSVESTPGSGGVSTQPYAKP